MSAAIKLDNVIKEPVSRMGDRLLRFPEVFVRTGLSESTIRRREVNGTFPRRVTLGPRAIGWYESDIADWVKDPTAYTVVG